MDQLKLKPNKFPMIRKGNQDHQSIDIRNNLHSEMSLYNCKKSTIKTVARSVREILPTSSL